tara:strand:- start:33 stop:404 length:372 start_codon:yes stop_codon:yes gene_type:complete
MKVKFTKTIDLNQIPSELRRMIDQVKNGVVYGLPESINEVVLHSLSSRGEVFFETNKVIDSFRNDLAIIDESLQEIQNILSGYQEAISPTPEPEPDLQHDENAEYEKFMSQIDGTDEVENEEG